MEENLRKNFLDTLHGKKVGTIPALSVTQTGTVELMDMTGAAWPEAHSDPEKMAALALAGYEIPDLQNRILYNKPILSHSTQENGLSRGKNRRNNLTIYNPDKAPTLDTAFPKAKAIWIQ